MDSINDFSKLDAQDEMSRLAQSNSEEAYERLARGEQDAFPPSKPAKQPTRKQSRLP